MILNVEHVTKKYGKQPGVEDISFTIPKGKVIGFVGANGAGKTTTLKAILGFHSIQSGNITLFGRSHTDERARENLGFLPEQPYFYDGLTGLEFLEFYGRLSGLSKERARVRALELTELVGLSHAARRLLRTYSKGMTQRMGIAQAIIHEPELLILDEPMSGLDPLGRLEVRKILQTLKAKGKTIFFSSHILSDVEALCDEVILIHRGRLVTGQEGDRVLRSGVKYYEWIIAGLAIEKGKKLFPQARFIGPWKAPSTSNDGVVIHLDQEPSFETHRLIHDQGGRVQGILPARESLEDTFFKMAREGRP